MKRIHLSVDVEDNELLDKSVKEALLGQARQIGREAVEKVLTAEIERIVEYQMKDLETLQSWSTVSTRITNILIQKVTTDFQIDHDAINRAVEKKLEEHLDKLLSRRGGLDKLVETHLKKTIASLIIKSDE